MSNIFFANLERLKTIARFLIYDKLSVDEHNLILYEKVTYKGKDYNVKVEVKASHNAKEKSK